MGENQTIDLKYLKEAIKISEKSFSEDDRVHPTVGVVIIKDGTVICKSYRNEFGEGGHAEFEALERHCIGKDLEGATLITTLEPCTVRKPLKVPCARRVIRRRIGKVIIGMLDPCWKVYGKGKKMLEDAGIVVEYFPPELEQEVRKLNSGYIQEQEREEKQLEEEEGTISESQRNFMIDILCQKLDHHEIFELYFHSGIDMGGVPATGKLERIGNLVNLLVDENRIGRLYVWIKTRRLDIWHEYGKGQKPVADRKMYLKNKRKAIADFLLFYYDLKGNIGTPIFRTADGNSIEHPFFTMGNWEATAARIKFKLDLDPRFGKESYLPDNYDEIVRERQKEAKEKGKVFIDRKTYRLLSISTSTILDNNEQMNQIELKMNMSSYAGFVLTCRESSRELNEELEGRKAFVEQYHEKTELERVKEFEVIRNTLVQRGRWAPDSESFAGNLLNRSGKLGIDMVLVFNDGKGYKCLIQERSDMVLEQPGAFGVVPAGTFQPPYLKDSDRTHWLNHCNLEMNVFRELYEEVLGGTTGQSEGEDDDTLHSIMMQYPPLKEFEKLRERKKAGIFFTGLGFSLLHTGPGIVGFIVIKDPKFYKQFYHKYFKRNWESVGIKPVEFSRVSLEPYMSRGDIMGCAATALIQALDHFGDYIDRYLI